MQEGGEGERERRGEEGKRGRGEEEKRRRGEEEKRRRGGGRYRGESNLCDSYSLADSIYPP